jgi:flagellar M-ring protein FliF
MGWSDYWGALSARRRTGLLVGVAIIVAATAALAVWLLRDPYVPLASGLAPEGMNEVARDLERAKIPFRIGAKGDEILVARSDVGKARATAADTQAGWPPSVGLELFKEPDFSSTDFAQRINYQRALQGELTRTIQTIAGVRAARVHVILADPGVFKRDSAKARAAVSVTLKPGRQLTATQVRGMQRLVAASVPEIALEDVVVLDESGASLTRASGEQGEVASAQLDLKREADQYLAGKLTRLLQDLVPQGSASVSVDAKLDDRQLRVTTEEPIAARGSSDAQHATGVLVKERQSQRGRVSDSSMPVDTIDGDSTDIEYEYTVGRRVEQALSAPGSIRRLSVAVALQGAPPDLSSAAVEQLVANAVGIDRARGDSVAVLLMPALHAITATAAERPIAPPIAAGAVERAPLLEWIHTVPQTWRWELIFGIAVLAFAVAAWWRTRSSPRSEEDRISEGAEPDAEAIATRVRQWLHEGVRSDV